ncbi:MAG: InlB B-repeat-containing protein [Clostridia bacterium]|nr:InlB B-repeat-containing protein [Clostridia bacterium]
MKKITVVLVLILMAVFVLTACVKTESFKVTFVDYDGTVIKTLYVAKGSDATAPADPIREADDDNVYTFAGWNVDFSYITGNITVTATYTTVPITYEVQFVDYDGTVLKAETVAARKAATAPDDPIRADDDTYSYTFIGWDKDYSSIIADTVITATYEQTIIPLYLLTVSAGENGTINDVTGEYKQGEIVNLVATPNEDYYFVGWYIGTTLISSDKEYAYTVTAEDGIIISALFKFAQAPGYYLAWTANNFLEGVNLTADNAWKLKNATFSDGAWFSIDCFGIRISMGDDYYSALRSASFKIIHVLENHTVEELGAKTYTMPTTYCDVFLCVEFKTDTNEIILHELDHWEYFSPFF